MNCECGNIAERNGKCASCNRLERNAQKPKPKKEAAKLPKFSDKMEKALKVYSLQRRLFLEDHPKCAVYPHLHATEVHHKKGRATIELLLDEEFWLPVSRIAHHEIENNPHWARSMGYSLSRLSTI